MRADIVFEDSFSSCVRKPELRCKEVEEVSDSSSSSSLVSSVSSERHMTSSLVLPSTISLVKTEVALEQGFSQGVCEQ